MGGVSRGGGGGAGGGLAAPRPPARVAAPANLCLAGNRSAGVAAAGFACWIAVARAGRRRSNSRPATPSRPRSASTISLSSWFFSGVRDQPRAPAQSAAVGGVGRIRAAAAVHRSGRHPAAPLRLGTWIFGLFLLYAAWRLVRGGRRARQSPAVDSCSCSLRRARCCR